MEGNTMKHMKQILALILVLAMLLCGATAVADDLGFPDFGDEPAAPVVTAAPAPAPQFDDPTPAPAPVATQRPAAPQEETPAPAADDKQQDRAPASGSSRLSVMANEVKGVIVSLNGGYVNLRQGPSKETDSIARMQPGDEVAVLEVWEGWVRVRTAQSVEGFVMDSFIILFADESDVTAVKPAEAPTPADDNNEEIAPADDNGQDPTPADDNNNEETDPADDNGQESDPPDDQPKAPAPVGGVLRFADVTVAWETEVPAIGARVKMEAQLEDGEQDAPVTWQVRAPGGEWTDCGAGQTYSLVIDMNNYANTYRAFVLRQ